MAGRGRPPLEIGRVGSKVNATRGSDGLWRGSIRYRGQDGVVKAVSVFRKTKSAAESDAMTRAQELAGQAIAAAGITPDTPLRDLGKAWLADIEGTVSPQTLRDYKHHIETIICAPNTGLGSVRVRKATTGRMDVFVQRVAKDTPASARKVRRCLNGMMGLAARHDAASENTVRDTKSVAPAAKGEIRTLTLKQLHELRAQVRAWARGDAIPGRDAAPVGGQGRSRDVADIVDVFLGTGARPAELLALRWSDIGLTSFPATVTISGTLVTLPASEGGLIRQGWPKTAASYAVLPIPNFARDTLRRRKAEAEQNEVDAVFPSQVGGWRSPANFRRIWRDARGEGDGSFDWVTPKSFRKTVITLVSNEKGDSAAARQARHADDGDVARKHYINRPDQAPDQTDLLDMFAPVSPE